MSPDTITTSQAFTAARAQKTPQINIHWKKMAPPVIKALKGDHKVET